jgi:hypothetical protein
MLSAVCCSASASEFTMDDDAVWQVDCTQVFHLALFFVEQNHSPPVWRIRIVVMLEKMP